MKTDIEDYTFPHPEAEKKLYVPHEELDFSALIIRDITPLEGIHMTK
jgi:hypothetical protein